MSTKVVEDTSSTQVDPDYLSRLEYIYRWFEANRKSFVPAKDILSHEFFVKHKIKATNELHVMVQDASDPNFDDTILYL